MHLQPVFGRICTFQERGRDESPLGLWGRGAFWMRTGWFDASCRASGRGAKTRLEKIRLTPEQAAGTLTPLPRGAVGRGRGWGLGASALELARWMDRLPTPPVGKSVKAPRPGQPRHSGSDVQRDGGEGVITDLDAGRWMLDAGNLTSCLIQP